MTITHILPENRFMAKIINSLLPSVNQVNIAAFCAILHYFADPPSLFSIFFNLESSIFNPPLFSLIEFAIQSISI
jgi:hypothetical protein